MRTLVLVPLAAALTAGAALAQQVTTRTLAAPDAKFAEPFSNLGSLRELRDGRIVAADPTEKVLQLIDLRSGAATAIGREGSGPLEWGLPYRLFAFPGDSTLLHDLPNSRYMVIAPDGKPARTFNPIADAAVAGRGAPPSSAIGGGGAAGGPVGFSFTGGGGPGGIGRVTDGRGGLYSVAPAFVRTASGMTSADSAPITRFDVNSGKIDTLAYVNLAKNSGSMSQSGSGSNQSVTIRMGSSAPFPAADEWTILPDGRVAIVRVADYHVEIVQRDGRRVKGPAVPFTPIRVTEAEKEAWREARRTARPVTMSIGNSGAGTNRQVTTGGPGLGQVQEPDSWPETMPPFVGSATWAAPNGEVWVLRTRSAREKNPAADVFNAQGQLVSRILMPERTRIVGFGARHVYLVRMDDDDLQYLERYPLN